MLVALSHVERKSSRVNYNFLRNSFFQVTVNNTNDGRTLKPSEYDYVKKCQWKCQKYARPEIYIVTLLTRQSVRISLGVNVIPKRTELCFKCFSVANYIRPAFNTSKSCRHSALACFKDKLKTRSKYVMVRIIF